MAKWVKFSKNFDFSYSERPGEVVAYSKSDEAIRVPVAHADAAVEAGAAEEVDAPDEAADEQTTLGRRRRGRGE